MSGKEIQYVERGGELTPAEPAAPEPVTGWREEDGVTWHVYADEAAYLQHQRAKTAGLSAKDIEGRSLGIYSALVKRLPDMLDVRGKRVLCLGARGGGEVRAFREGGAFAIGIDLCPGEENRYVHYGDVHYLPFPNGCVDMVYTNSLDHVNRPGAMLDEIRRVLAPDGVFVLEAFYGGVKGHRHGAYECLWWESIDCVLKRWFADWRILSRRDIDGGKREQLVMEPA